MDLTIKTLDGVMTKTVSDGRISQLLESAGRQISYHLRRMECAWTNGDKTESEYWFGTAKGVFWFVAEVIGYNNIEWISDWDSNNIFHYYGVEIYGVKYLASMWETYDDNRPVQLTITGVEH